MRRLAVAFVLTVVFVVVEAIAAFVAGSLALLSDAGHMLTDGAAIGLALGAIVVANRASTEGSRTFGLYRLEILASLANALLLFAVAGYVHGRGRHPARRRHRPTSRSVPMLVVAIAGLAVNAIVFVLLRDGARGSLAVKSAALEALADAVGSVGVIVAAVVVATTGWEETDAIVAIGISLWILPRAWHLAGSALRVLLQVAPVDVDLDAIHRRLAALPGVVDVHDLHVWTLTSEMDVASAHVMVSPTADAHAVLDRRACAARVTPDRARHDPGGARRPRRVRRAQLVTVDAVRGRPGASATACRGRGVLVRSRSADADREPDADADRCTSPPGARAAPAATTAPASGRWSRCRRARWRPAGTPTATSTSGTAAATPRRAAHTSATTPSATPTIP